MGLPMKCSLINFSGACSPQVGQFRETSVPERKLDRTTGPLAIARGWAVTCVMVGVVGWLVS
ncbi:hypothetical protein AUH73_05045 [archaeon 13_1_40CM_4_53_4]|nr:MAG: hypothetical protein AUH73_05045 [archaeon 13_1_40CM_4_53_4]